MDCKNNCAVVSRSAATLYVCVSFVCGFASSLIVGCEAGQKVDKAAEDARIIVTDPELGVSDEISEPVVAVADAIDDEGNVTPEGARDVAISLGAGESTATLIGIGAALVGAYIGGRKQASKSK